MTISHIIIEHCKSGDEEKVIELLRSGVSPNTREDMTEQTIGHIAAGYGHRSIIAELCSHPRWNPALLDWNQLSAADCALAQGRHDIADMISQRQREIKSGRSGPAPG